MCHSFPPGLLFGLCWAKSGSISAVYITIWGPTSWAAISGFGAQTSDFGEGTCECTKMARAEQGLKRWDRVMGKSEQRHVACLLVACELEFEERARGQIWPMCISSPPHPTPPLSTGELCDTNAPHPPTSPLKIFWKVRSQFGPKGAGIFFSIWRGVNFRFYSMCLYSEYSEFHGESKYACKT